MIDENEEQLKAHIKAIVEAGDQSDTLEERPLTMDELKELAISMGLTEEEWLKLVDKSKVHLKASDDHLAARNFKEAVEEGKMAIALNPYIKNGNAVLAKSYLMLWLEDHDSYNRDRAEYHARKELKVDPRDQMAVYVLSTIEKKSSLLESDNKSKKIVFIAIGIVVGILLIGFVWRSCSNDGEKSTTTTESTNDAEYERTRDELIEAEEDVISKWDMVQTAISRRNNLIPKLFAVVETSDEEVELLNSTIEDLQEKIKNTDGEERFRLENDLDAKVNEAKTLIQMRTDSSSLETLLIQIEGSENRIAFEKKEYNSAVKHYNILVKKHRDDFPEYEVKPYFNEQ